MIWLTDSPPPVVADVAVAAVGYEQLVPTGIPIVPLEEVRGRAGVVLIAGLSRILTPSNRVKVGQLVLRPRPGLTRIVVDRFLFVAEPWRAFWPFLAVGVPYRDYTDSFLAESRWEDARAQQLPDPFSLAEIQHHAVGVLNVRPDAPTLPQLDVTTIPVSTEFREKYEVEKAAVFEQETSLAAIVRRLGVTASEAVPSRSIPTPMALFGPGFTGRVVASDLPVDRFLIDRLRSVVAITNGLAAVPRC